MDSWGTTQPFHNCLEWAQKDLSDREPRWPNCGINIKRDENSALTDKLGLKWLGYALGVNTPMEPWPLPSLRWQAWALKWEAIGFSRGESVTKCNLIRSIYLSIQA